jgi:SAM-dependent methyltransferase
MKDDRLEIDDPHRVHAVVREKYGAIARGSGSCCGSSNAAQTATTNCCGPAQPDAVLDAIGYTAEQAAAIPEGANLGLGCGNPLAHAGIRPGETVLDLGSGAGIDAFLAAREVGPAGRVIGVDMTPEMLERARANAARSGHANVDFRLGEIEHLPVADASVDLVVSNCVINLSPDKSQVFREAFRVLRPGGRVLVSDLVLTRPLPEDVRRSVSAYVGCVAGASLRDEYLSHLRAAGFVDVEVVQERRYTVGLEDGDEAYRAGLGSVVSVQVRARRP